MPSKAVPLMIAGGGAILLWSALEGKSWSTVLRDVISGTNPTTAPNTNAITAGAATLDDTTGSAASVSADNASGENETGSGTNEQILQATAAEFGWTTANGQWQALANVENAEAGFSTTAVNPTSGALGMAQALGHGGTGTAGSLGNEYGGYGLTTAQAVAANSGNAQAQALWMCNYVKATYSLPSNAWAHEQEYHWY